MSNTSDKHINTAESATGTRGTGAPLIAAGDAASTEAPKVPGCTIAITRKSHPFDPSKSLVFVRGAWADGSYAAFPCTSDGKSLTAAPIVATNTPGGVLRQFRKGGGYFTYAGHYTLGYVIVLNAQSVDDTMAWLSQLQGALEARIPQTGKPAGDKPKAAKEVMPTAF